jgi:hypothetical protein
MVGQDDGLTQETSKEDRQVGAYMFDCWFRLFVGFVNISGSRLG